MAEYILELRKKVGNVPLIQCGASVIVENERGEILLELRADSKDWSYVGGGMELYERTEETAARELTEETGLIADELTMLGVFSGREMGYVYPNGDQVSNVEILYICRKYHGELKRQEAEVESLRFFAPDHMPGPFFPPNQPGMAAYLKQRGIEEPFSMK